MRRTLAVTVAVLVQLALVGAATADQLSARIFGEDYLMRVAPLDPIDPFRGAYVELSYPDLGTSGQDGTSWPLEPSDGGLDRHDDTVYVPLEPDGPVWVGAPAVRSRPSTGPYLRCHADGRIRCGIESLFLPQEDALAMERELASGNALARVRVDGRGNASVIEVVPAP